MPEQDDKNIAVIAAHMQHLVADMSEMKADLKVIPEKMAVLYVPKEEFNQFKRDFQEVRSDIRNLSTKMDERDSKFVTREEIKEMKFVTRDQFAPVRNGLYGVVGLVVAEIIRLIFTFFGTR